jgi:hypothetical protein
MRPLTIGRVLGVGVRVAGRVVSQRIAESAQAAAVGPSQTSAQPARNGQVPTSAARRTGAKGGSVAKGVSGFLRPFSRVGGIVWNEVMGVFFLLPVVAFTPNLWRMRSSWAHGPDHTMFLVTAGVVLVFLYLGISSFWRARRKARGN